MVFTFNTMLWLAIGVTIGVGVGAMPGLTATTGVALMLPLTFTMDQAAALGLLIGLYKGAIYGGSISAISFATPGTSEAAATVFDGHKLMRRGKGKKSIINRTLRICNSRFSLRCYYHIDRTDAGFGSAAIWTF